MVFNFLNNLLNILKIFKGVLFDVPYSMLLSKLHDKAAINFLF